MSRPHRKGKTVVETRCEHGFLRSVVTCGECDLTTAKVRSRAVGNRRRQHNFVDLSGTTIAGARVESQSGSVDGKAIWLCTCACGAPFEEQARYLRAKQESGRAASCLACKPNYKNPPKPRGRRPHLIAKPIPEEHRVSIDSHRCHVPMQKATG